MERWSWGDWGRFSALCWNQVLFQCLIVYRSSVPIWNVRVGLAVNCDMSPKYLSLYNRGWAEQEPRISIPVPAVPVSELLAGNSQRICNSLNWFMGVTFTFWIKIDRKNIFPKINSKIYKFSVFFPARSSDTGTARTGIEILGSCSAHPLGTIRK